MNRRVAYALLISWLPLAVAYAAAMVWMIDLCRTH